MRKEKTHIIQDFLKFLEALKRARGGCANTQFKDSPSPQNPELGSS